MSKTRQIVFVFQFCFLTAMVAKAGTINLYIPNSDDATVSVIDAETNLVTATVPVGEKPKGIVAHPDGSRVYVANRNSNTLSVIDTMTNEVTATVPMAGGPFGIDINADGSLVYVANRNVGLVPNGSGSIVGGFYGLIDCSIGQGVWQVAGHLIELQLLLRQIAYGHDVLGDLVGVH